MKATVLALAILAVGVSAAPACAQERGKYVDLGLEWCNDYREAKRCYEKNPDDPAAAITDSICVALRNRNRDALFLSNAPGLDWQIRSGHRVRPAFFQAQLIETGGSFGALDHRRCDAAIRYYFRALSLINLLNPHYPEGRAAFENQTLYEKAYQMELWTRYKLAFLHCDKFRIGIMKAEHDALLRSPGYAGEENPELSNIEVQSCALHPAGNLGKTGEFGDRCAERPGKTTSTRFTMRY